MSHTETSRCATIISFFLLAAGCFAQAPAPAFEVASIRPTGGIPPECQRTRGCLATTPTSLSIRNEQLRFLIQWAYDVPPMLIEGPPSLNEVRFDLVAKAAASANEMQLRQMLQTLLADRFGLKLHKESRSMQAYALVLAKGGPKFQEATTEGSFVLEASSPVMLNAHHARMADLAQGIGAEVGRPIADETGLKGRYEIHLDLSPYMAQAGAANGGQLDVMSILFTGFKDMLGLQLEPRKATFDVLVVDHVEKTPTEN